MQWGIPFGRSKDRTRENLLLPSPYVWLQWRRHMSRGKSHHTGCISSGILSDGGHTGTTSAGFLHPVGNIMWFNNINWLSIQIIPLTSSVRRDDRAVILERLALWMAGPEAPFTSFVSLFLHWWVNITKFVRWKSEKLCRYLQIIPVCLEQQLFLLG